MSTKMKRTTFQKLVLVGTLVFFVLFGAFLFTGYYIRETEKASMRQMEQGMLDQMEEKFEDYHQNLMQVAASMVYSPTVYACFFQDSFGRVVSNEAVTAVFSNTFHLEGSIVDVFLYDREGAQIASAGRETEELHDLECLKEWESQVAYSGLFELPVTNELCYAMFYPVFELESQNYAEQIGLCVIVMRTQGLQEILSDAQFSLEKRFYLVDTDSRILAAFGKGAEQMEELESASSACDKRELVLDGWTLALREPDAGMSFDVSTEIVLIGAAYLLAAVLVLWLLIICYRNLVHPIQELDEFVRKVSGNPGLRITVKDKNEIGKVEQELNHMLDNLERKSVQIQEMKEWAYQMELAGKQLQILAYRNQIHPHFLYNTLDCIRALAVLNDQKPIAAIAMALSKMFRFAVREENVITVEEEVSYVREYARIIDYRFNGKIRIQIDVEEEVLSRPMIKLIFQPMIENAVFHGLERKVGGGTVNASVSMAGEGRMCLRVEDNGCGMSEKKLELLRKSLAGEQKEGGIGLPNVCHRLKLFYGEEMEFSIDSREGEGTSVVIEIADYVTDRRVLDVPDFSGRR